MSKFRAIATLDELVDVATERDDLFVRWSADPEGDCQRGTSIDELTGVELPGLSANPLRVEPWWENRSLEMWVARRLYDYHHLAERRGPGVCAWVLAGDVVGRGPDNEPLVRCREVVGTLSDKVTATANELVDSQPHEWGTLDRC